MGSRDFDDDPYTATYDPKDYPWWFVLVALVAAAYMGLGFWHTIYRLPEPSWLPWIWRGLFWWVQ